MLPSCQQDHKLDYQQQKLMDVFVRYIYPEKAYKVQVSFSHMDSMQQLIPQVIDGQVLFHNHSLLKRSIGDQLIRYETNFRGDPEKEMKLIIQSASEWDLQQTLPMVPIDQVTISPSINREGYFDFSAAPSNLDKDEILVLLFSDQNNQAASISLNGPLNMTKTTVSGEALKNLSPGPGRVYAVRKKDVATSTKHIDIRWSTEFYTDEQSIEIK